MKKITMILALALFCTGCYKEFDTSEPEAPEEPEPEEVCGNAYDDDGDTLVDEDDCVSPPNDQDAATEDAVEDAEEEDALEDVPDTEEGEDAEDDTVEDATEDMPQDTGTDADADAAADVPEDTSEDVPEDDAPTGPPPSVGWLEADFRDYVSNPADAVESRLYGTITAGTYATLPGTPSALCAFGSWNEWSYETGRVCMSWSPSFTPGRPFYTRGGDTGYFFTYGSSHYEVDLSKFDFVDTAPCYSATTTMHGVTRQVLRCPVLPELDICTNGEDDDHDGLVDSDDPDCDTFWEPPAEPDMTNRLTGTAIGGCVNFSGTFWFDSRDGYGLVRALNEGEHINRVTAYHDAMSGCDSSPCFSIAYPGDGNPVNFTVCGFTWVQPAVTTSWGATLRMDVTSLVLSGDICRTSGNTAITAWGLGTCGESSSEICDGLDNDGDGLIDEGHDCFIGQSESCTTSCGSIGTKSCRSNCTWGACQPPAETCNGRDDDCDGIIDEYCSSSDRFEIIGRDYGTYREIEIVATLNANHSTALADNPSRLNDDEDIGSICVTYGSANWDSQIWDPYFYHTDPAPCQIYDRDNASVYLYLPAGVDEFLLFAIGTRGDPRHRAWFNVYAWDLTGIRRTEYNIFSF